MFRALGDGIAVYSRFPDVHTAEGATTMASSSTALKADPFIAATSVQSWIEDFNAHRNATGAFTYPELYAWTTSAVRGCTS